MSVYQGVTSGQGTINMSGELVEAEMHTCTKRPDSNFELVCEREIQLSKVFLQIVKSIKAYNQNEIKKQ